MLYVVKGKVTNTANNPVRRKLYLINRETGALIDQNYSDTLTGEYELKTAYPDPVLVVCLPLPGETLNAICYDNVTPVKVEFDEVYGIGVPGTLGFGVGVAPDIPAGWTGMDGYTNKASPNYGNYKTANGAIMVWIPAFYYKWGNVSNGLAMNKCDIKDVSAYADEATANVAGYALHRAFIDGGQVKKGFFVDKYKASRNETLNIPTSVPFSNPIFVAAGGGMSEMNVSQTHRGCVDAAKLRGAGFHITSVFIYNALAMISKAHADNSTSTENNGFYDPTYNFVKGVNNANSFSPCSFDTNLKIYWSSAVKALTGSANKPAAVSHNGQACGVHDLAGNQSEVTVGLTCITTPSYSVFALKESFALKNGTSSNTSATDFWQVSNFNNIYTSASGDWNGLPNTATEQYRQNGTQIFSAATSRTDSQYLFTCCGVPLSGNVSTTVDRTVPGAIKCNYTNLSVPLYGGDYSDTAQFGIFRINLGQFAFSGSTTNSNMGFRVSYYV